MVEFSWERKDFERLSEHSPGCWSNSKGSFAKLNSIWNLELEIPRKWHFKALHPDFDFNKCSISKNPITYRMCLGNVVMMDDLRVFIRFDETKKLIKEYLKCDTKEEFYNILKEYPKYID